MKEKGLNQVRKEWGEKQWREGKKTGRNWGKERMEQRKETGYCNDNNSWIQA